MNDRIIVNGIDIESSNPYNYNYSATNNLAAMGSSAGRKYDSHYDDYYISNDIASFEAKLKLLNVNGAINQQMKSDSADPGFTPLDTFIEKNYNTCKDAQSKYNTNANKVKQCSSESVFK